VVAGAAVEVGANKGGSVAVRWDLRKKLRN